MVQLKVESKLTKSDLLKGLAVLIIAAGVSFWASGCTTAAKKPTGPEMAAHSSAPVSYLPPVERRHQGSLFGTGRRLRLYDDLRARETGDIVTVSVVENASANKQATTQSDRSQSLDAGISAAFGYKWTNKGFIPAASAPEASSMFKGSFDNKFKGTGKTDRSDSMSASIACRVVKVLPSGNLYIKGSRLVQVNYEQQEMTLEGVIRPADISPKNVVLSTHVADAKISYSGTGPVSDKQRPGWLSRVLDFIWPF